MFVSSCCTVVALEDSQAFWRAISKPGQKMMQNSGLENVLQKSDVRKADTEYDVGRFFEGKFEGATVVRSKSRLCKEDLHAGINRSGAYYSRFTHK
jgi:hypothetical protein